MLEVEAVKSCQFFLSQEEGKEKEKQTTDNDIYISECIHDL